MSDATTLPAADARVRASWLELAAAAVLGIAATLTAVAAYLSAGADGDELEAFNTATAKLTDTNFFYQRANQTIAQDHQLFVAYLEASQTDQETTFITDLMSPELEEAIDDWSSDADMAAPFDSEAYVLDDIAAADQLEVESNAALDDAAVAGERGDALNLANVVFAVALFAAGILNVFPTRRLQVGLLGAAVILVIGGAGIMATGA